MVRRLLVATVAAAVLLPAAPAAALGGVGARWQFLGIGSSQRTLHLLVERSPCLSPNLQLEEGRYAVLIQFWPGLPPGPGCPSPTHARLTIKLGAPLAGRSLAGGGAVLVPGAPGSRAVNVVGLASREAIGVLNGNGMRATVVERRRAPGVRRVLAQRGTRLVVSRP